jgi:hypothetical protein
VRAAADAGEKPVSRFPSAKRLLRSVALGLGLSFLFLAAYVVIYEDSFIYFPTQGDVGPSPGEDVELSAADGVRLHAWWIPAPGSKTTILYLHGNGGHIGDRRDFIGRLRRMPADVLALDYRGYGKSGGKPSEPGLYQDARAAYDWLRAKGIPAARIVALGKSLGGAPAAELATQAELGGLVLQSTFTSTPDMSRRVMPFFPARLLMRTRYDTLSKVGRIGCPKLILHGRADDMIPFDMGERIFAAAAEPKESHWFERGDHNDMVDVNGPEYEAVLRRFLEKVAKP